MNDINTIQADPRFEEFCVLASYFQTKYGVKVWHSNVFNVPEGREPEDCDIIKDFYLPLQAAGFNLDNEVYCYGGPQDG